VVPSLSVAFTFPAGKLRHVAIVATAGNVAAGKTPTASKRWLVIGGYIRLVNDGTVANRYITLEVLNVAAKARAIGNSPAITAGQTRDLDFGEGKVTENASLGDSAYGQNYLGHDPILVDGTDVFNVRVAGGVAGDSYTGIVTVLEMDV
jgi:hypothetical protein